MIIIGVAFFTITLSNLTLYFKELVKSSKVLADRKAAMKGLEERLELTPVEAYGKISFIIYL